MSSIDQPCLCRCLVQKYKVTVGPLYGFQCLLWYRQSCRTQPGVCPPAYCFLHLSQILLSTPPVKLVIGSGLWSLSCLRAGYNIIRIYIQIANKSTVVNTHNTGTVSAILEIFLAPDSQREKVQTNNFFSYLRQCLSRGYEK